MRVVDGMHLKKKYTEPKGSRHNPYRTRTGPDCCNDGCRSSYKKSQKALPASARISRRQA